MIIDEISMSINMVDVEDIEGKSSDMIVQKQIVATTQLLDKVEKLKDQIDAGDLDGKDILNSEAPSSRNPMLDNPYATRTSTPVVKVEGKNDVSKRASMTVFGVNTPFGKKNKGV